jgi:hypothetical protein
LEENLVYDIENVVENIDFSMKMEDMPLTDDDKNRLRSCLSGKSDIQKIIQETIQKHTVTSLA